METATTEENLDVGLTASAVEQIKKLVARDARAGCGLRIAVTDGGCSGYSYKLDFDNQQRPNDLVLNRDGVTLYVDNDSAPYLAGTVIDFVGGLYGGGFKFTNPNATATCGCGTSFSA
jgi:iron-sulfur cluster assembly protein